MQQGVGTYDCDGTGANGYESTTACGPATCTVVRTKVLMINHLAISC
ncbi:hypothetical protein [Stigmatella aurantiaca]|uniref:Uncharacterized protein n=1 Tax=Stigmatella aurantiaca (strain DW4/3-1) TaxID=378806 RepID=Q08WV2_STIAD|nr:hypothetical protein [Stigmatella aurantiaca]EAU64984.1 hypothetical protein STIAU_4430 [Stigmatella aurantiaca DW4/3-1]